MRCNMAISEARARATAKYDSKTYKKLSIALRLDDDAEIIKSLDEAQQHGISYREWLKELFYNGRAEK